MVSVIDGNTVKIEIDGRIETVQLIGLDVPEWGSSAGSRECFGDVTIDRVRRLLPRGRDVWLETDASADDESGHPLRYVWIVSPSGVVNLVQEYLIREGFGAFAPDPLTPKRDARLQNAQATAVAKGTGLWTACGAPHLAWIPTPTPTPTSTPVPPLLTDCSEFASFAKANDYYRKHPEVQSFLDPNLDGRACEVYFGVDQPQSGGTTGGSDGSSGDCTYVNVDGNVVSCPIQADGPPAGATARCNDGSWSFSQHRRGTCSHHGGVAYWL